MSITAQVAVWKLDLPPSTKLVALAIADHCSEDLACWPRVSTLATKCGMTGRTIRRHLEVLEGEGLLVREARRNVLGRQTSNLCRLRLPEVEVRVPSVPGVTPVSPLAELRGDTTDSPRGDTSDTPRGDASDTPLNPHRESPEESPTSTPGRPAPPDDADDVVEWIPCSGRRPTRANRYGAPLRPIPEGGSEYGVRQAEVDELAAHYPGVDVQGLLYALAEWARSRPGKRRTYTYLSSWLAGRCADRQNRGGPGGGGGGAGAGRPRSQRQERVAQGHNPHWKMPEPEDFVNTGLAELRAEAKS